MRLIKNNRYTRRALLTVVVLLATLAVHYALSGETTLALAALPVILLTVLGYQILAARAAARHLRRSTKKARRARGRTPGRNKALGSHASRNRVASRRRKGASARTRARKGKRDQRRHLSFPVIPASAAQPKTNVRVGVILDEFSMRAFSYEWVQVPLDPEDWQTQLDAEQLDLIFVESAWEGNGGAWRYHLAGKSAPRPSLVQLVETARERGIPTVFWNKEDPPHYEDFLPTARLFDYVFTSDSNKIPSYLEDLGHDRVATLPFAAQPAIHNPIRNRRLPRDRGVAFGGMYFRHKYPERRAQMDALLAAAMPFKLDIFSRQHGGDPNYQFPMPYDTYVRGALPYDEMLSAYKSYKVVLNVNSVVDSPSMCARRIFEATASGAAILSGPSRAIPAFFPEGEIRTAETEREATLELRTLMKSAEYRERLVHRAQREVWRKHTYAHRAHDVLAAAGISGVASRSPLVTVVAPTYRPHQVESLIRSASSQVGVRVQLVILQHGFDTDEGELKHLAMAAGVEDCVVLRAPRDVPLGGCLNRAISAADGDFVARMDDDDYYGPHYLEDLLFAHRFTDADLLGKSAAYCYFESTDTTVLLSPDQEHKWAHFVRGATFFGPRSTFVELPFLEVGASEDTLFLRQLEASGGRIYASDRFNFAIHRSADKSAHTWTVGDQELFASGTVKFFGDPRASVFV